jgi:alkaline phosphatase
MLQRMIESALQTRHSMSKCTTYEHLFVLRSNHMAVPVKAPLVAVTSTLLATLSAGCASLPHGDDDSARQSLHVDVPTVVDPSGETAQWWYRSGAARAAANGAMSGRARNVIVFLGDGMSLTTVAAARILEGQRSGRPGEEHLLSWEHFPHTAFSKTYNTDSQTPDSAGTMT